MNVRAADGGRRSSRRRPGVLFGRMIVTVPVVVMAVPVPVVVMAVTVPVVVMAVTVPVFMTRRVFMAMRMVMGVMIGVVGILSVRGPPIPAGGSAPGRARFVRARGRRAVRLDDEATPQEGTPAARLEPHVQPLHAHGGDGVFHDLRRYTRVDQRGDRHVPGDAGHRIEVHVLAAQVDASRGGLAGGPALHSPGFRFNIVAIRPAPNPLSMLTTAIPAAHAFSMDSSAATPPRLAP